MCNTLYSLQISEHRKQSLHFRYVNLFYFVLAVRRQKLRQAGDVTMCVNSLRVEWKWREQKNQINFGKEIENVWGNQQCRNMTELHILHDLPNKRDSIIMRYFFICLKCDSYWERFFFIQDIINHSRCFVYERVESCSRIYRRYRHFGSISPHRDNVTCKPV